ncbi:DUF916 and DUF3324 domain-containing protein [Listeria valentina]|uniref:DUF916 and DUF3324 domain-containing protein n=1 Tax=Listeria valentina TaxID=2705293 RepID=UPI00143178C2|nr:DUF916 and DUF3324 domain-containing protein [Listeria valentina]
MKRKIIGIVGFFAVVFLAFGVFQSTAKAATSMPFSVSAVLPDNQVDKTKTYFDLRMRPGEKQIIEVELANASDREVTVETSANTAITNDNGIVDYSYTGHKFDKTLKYPFSSLAETDKETTIPKQSSKRVQVVLTMPKDGFKGAILGGLHFKEKEHKNAKQKESSGVQIENKYAFVVGVVLQESDEKQKESFDLREIKPSQVNFRNVLKANVQNKAALIVPEMEIKAYVTKKGDNKTLFETNKEHLRMAPNSNFNYGIGWDNKPFKPGKYTLHMQLKASDKTWKWTKDFEIERKEAKKFNDRAVELEKDYTMYYIIGGAILVLTLLVVVYLLGRRSRQTKS